MFASKVQKQPKPNKVVVVSPQASPPKSAQPTPVAATLSRAQAAQHRISERAFEIFEKRGSQHGHDLQDWFRAERQILAR
jgi:sorbitol-specific phosphotransferase system component IIBC